MSFSWDIGSIGDAASVLGTVLGVVGFGYLGIQIRQFVREGRTRRNNDHLRHVIHMSGDSEGSYPTTFESLRAIYGEGGAGELFADRSYFAKTIGRCNKIFLSRDGNAGDCERNFPIVGKPEWLLSQNDQLTIDVVHDNGRSWQKVSANHGELIRASEKFLADCGVVDFAQFMKDIGRRVWDAPTFDLVLCEDRGGGRLKLWFQEGSYFNYVNVYELLRGEFYYHRYLGAHRGGRRVALRELKVRSSLSRGGRSSARGKGTDPFDFAGRPVKVGVCVFTLFKKPDGSYATFIQKRSQELLEAPNMFHVVPSGTFQPLSGFDNTEWNEQFNVDYTIMRELAEELFCMEEADVNRTAYPYNIFDLPIVESTEVSGATMDQIFGDLKSDLKSGNHQYKSFDIHLTGFFLDAISMKPALTAVLCVNDEDVYLNCRRKIEDSSGNWEGSIKEYQIGGDDSQFFDFLDRNLKSTTFEPNGAIAVAEGIDFVYRKLLSPSDGLRSDGLRDDAEVDTRASTAPRSAGSPPPRTSGARSSRPRAIRS